MPRTYEGVQSTLALPMRKVATVGEALGIAADRWPDQAYLTYAETGVTASFADVNGRVSDVAAALADVGVEAGDRVGLYLTNGPAFVEGIYACSRLGAVETPINWQYREREVRHAVESAEIDTVVLEASDDLVDVFVAVADDLDVLETVVVTSDHRFDDLEALATVDAHRLEDLIAADPSQPAAPDVGYEDPVAILYTSGTTGLPKPTVLSNKSFLLGAKSFLGMPISDDDTNYNPYPLFHANNQVYSMLGSAIHGSEYVLADAFSTSAFMDHVLDHGVTSFNIIGGVPKMLDAAFNAEDIPANPLKWAIGPIATGVWEAFEAKFDLDVLQLYSQTESLTVLANHPDPDAVKVGAIGQPMFPDLGHEAWVEDEDGTRLPPGEEGELVRSDPGAMIEYRGQPEKTRETLRDGNIYSGDVVYADEDGYVYYVDRKKFMIRRSGENISAQQVEDVIDEIPGVAESAVIPVPHEVRGEEVKAMVMCRDTSVTERNVVDQVAGTLAAYKVPRYVEFVDEFPRTPTERIKRVTLADAEADREDHGWDRDEAYPDWAEHA